LSYRAPFSLLLLLSCVLTTAKVSLASGIEKGTNHWAFQSIRTSATPSASPSLAEHDLTLDRLVDAKLKEVGLFRAPRAERRTLIRRVTFDLIGLPPTPGEVEAFLADDSPAAYDRLVDRLLASPQYGERWARWWLDLARYADTNGQDENKVMANAWRYRDWVVRALNADMGFDDFLTFQLAGDLLPTNGVSEATIAERTTATGFLILGPKMLAEQDKPKLMMDLVDEQIDVVCRAFLGLTVSCARCHDHKFDPIPTRDYYALAGIFRSTRSMANLDFVSRVNERPITPHRELEVIAAQEKLIASRDKAIATLTEEANAALTNRLKSGLPKEPRSQYPPDVRSQLVRMEQERDSLKSTLGKREFALSADESTVTNLPIHLRGSHLNLGPEPVPRGFLQIVSWPGAPRPPPNQSGRLELARWLTAPEQPLTARVVVNRLWMAHFGDGIVRTPDNFGLRGEPPTNPELLDWLAREFMKSGWRLKSIHRLILMSETYRQAAEVASEAARKPVGPNISIPSVVDPEDKYLWHFPRQRLEAEMIRDSLLAVSGQLDLTAGGSEFQWKDDDYVPEDSVSATSLRRSIYLPIVRDRMYDVFTIFDCANPSVGTAKRTPTVVTHQALFFLNSPLVKQAAKQLANALLSVPPPTSSERIRYLYLLALSRPPSVEEVLRAERFLVTAQSVMTDAQSPDQHLSSWTALCQTVLSANEFVYRD
jgi:hypothetical protein